MGKVIGSHGILKAQKTLNLVHENLLKIFVLKIIVNFFSNFAWLGFKGMVYDLILEISVTPCFKAWFMGIAPFEYIKLW